LYSAFMKCHTLRVKDTEGAFLTMPGSELARFRQEQAMQEQAAQQGLQGFAVVAPHKVITERMEQDASYLVQLIKDGKIEQCDQVVEQMTKELSYYDGKER
jgi:hypothetical protein